LLLHESTVVLYESIVENNGAGVGINGTSEENNGGKFCS
jgi:hypothetical protein